LVWGVLLSQKKAIGLLQIGYAGNGGDYKAALITVRKDKVLFGIVNNRIDITCFG